MVRLLRRLHAFWIEEDANVTIEFVLWLPVMLGVVMLSADATLLMHRQTLLYDAARDTSRQVALGQKTEDDAEAALRERLGDAEPYELNVDPSNG